MNRHQQKIEKLATGFYEQIREKDPDNWFEICSYLDLLAMRDHFGFAPLGLDPLMRERMETLRAELRAKTV
jgi:hypothetical protein